MKKEKLNRKHMIELNDVVQIDPKHANVFGGSFMIVTEIYKWGVQGYVQIPGKGQAYYRCRYEYLSRIGAAEWIANRESENGMD
jgi:hypothetical protein